MTAESRLFANLAAFLAPITEAAGLKLRPFSISFMSMTRLAGLHIGAKEFGDLSEDDRLRELSAVIVMLTTDEDAALAAALRAAKGDFETFYWDFVFARARNISAEGLAAAQTVLATELPAIEAAQVEVRTPPSMQGGADKPPPNS